MARQRRGGLIPQYAASGCILLLLGATLAHNAGIPAAVAQDTDWTDCLSCHADIPTGLPALAELRPAPGETTVRTDCRVCHSRAQLETLSGNWTHPVRPVADHLQCTDCHVVAPHGPGYPSLPLPHGDYKAESCYTCHREVDIARHWPSRHGAGIACRDCHPAHGEHRAGLPPSLLPSSLRRGVSRNYDWQLSNESCLKCHSSVALTTRLDSGFAVLNTVNYHELHVVRGQNLCIECHEPHGSVRPALLRSRLLDGESLSFMPRPDGGSCTTNCHGVEHRAWDYRNRIH